MRKDGWLSEESEAEQPGSDGLSFRARRTDDAVELTGGFGGEATG
jgi:hypothetical protein